MAMVAYGRFPMAMLAYGFARAGFSWLWLWHRLPMALLELALVGFAASPGYGLAMVGLDQI